MYISYITIQITLTFSNTLTKKEKNQQNIKKHIKNKQKN